MTRDTLPSLSAETFLSLDRVRSGDELSEGKFLVASRQITDPRFMETVILLTRHDSQGTVGLIVNHPTEIQLSQVFPEMKGLEQDAHVLYSGGPVGINQMQLLIHSQKELDETHRILKDVYLSSSRTVLERLLNGLRDKAQFHIYSGYAGWLPGQLEGEITRGDWHVVKADAETVFEKAPADIWPEFIRRTSVIQAQGR
ncbi:MAG TPA: YqgE/AlgH family protein [Thermodesulfovibrionales bacterium]|nr:YqgE/AlgH family protein [Thermodesulfovibrionales bacterium]